MSKSLTFDALFESIAGGAAAIRSITKLQPVGGKGDRVFPATFQGGVYAVEKRRVQENGEPKTVDCVLLNSNPSEANHAEEALLDAIRRTEIELPLIAVDFSEANKSFRKPLPNLTSLEVPHRLADAILRDCSLSDGTRFSKSSFAQEWSACNLWNATAIYKYCPTALLFGMWGSPEKPGGLGAKFERAYVSEIVGVDVDPIGILVADNKTGQSKIVPKRLGIRADPLGANKDVLVKKTDDGFELATKKDGVKPSEINHGNILVESPNCGVRFEYAEQTTVISFGALRKLRFPLNGSSNADIDNAARTVLAAIGLCAATFAYERGTSLRSRCHLWPTETRKWELLAKPGEAPASYEVSGKQAAEILKDAIHKAEGLGLHWMSETLTLKPTPELVELVRKSQEVSATKEGAEGE